MGDYDVVKAVLSRIADMRWMQIAIKPAKPFAFGLLDDGRPTCRCSACRATRSARWSASSCSPVPALRTMMALPDIDRRRVARCADAPFRRRPDGKTHFQRATAAFGADGRVHVAPVAAQGSHQLAATAMADAMVVLPDGDGAAPAPTSTPSSCGDAPFGAAPLGSVTAPLT